MTPIDLDHQRRRWADARRLDHLDLANSANFAAGGLGAHVDSLDLRVRFLPADPLAAPVRLDADAEQWLSEPRSSPHGGRAPDANLLKRATSSALVRYEQYNDERGWTTFVGLHRDGGLDFGEGHAIVHHHDDRFLPLQPVVGAVWHLAAMQLEAVQRWKIGGPFEVSVALAGVKGVQLGGFAEGWPGVGGIFGRHAPTCIEPNVLLRIEWDAVDPEALAMDVGERLENTFGSTNRRFIARSGDFQGKFDPRF